MLSSIPCLFGIFFTDYELPLDNIRDQFTAPILILYFYDVVSIIKIWIEGYRKQNNQVVLDKRKICQFFCKGSKLFCWDLGEHFAQRIYGISIIVSNIRCVIRPVDSNARNFGNIMQKLKAHGRFPVNAAGKANTDQGKQNRRENNLFHNGLLKRSRIVMDLLIV